MGPIELVLNFLTAAVQGVWSIQQIDITSAFLYADLDREIYMKQPEGFKDGTDRVWRLHKALYGLKQSPRQWSIKLSENLLKLGFKPIENKPSMYQRTLSGIMVTLVVYVDDILIGCKNKEETLKVKKDISNIFDIADFGEPDSFLSLNIQRNKGELLLDSRKNVRELLKNMESDLEKIKFRSMVPMTIEDAKIATRIEEAEANIDLATRFHQKPIQLSKQDQFWAEKISAEQHKRYRSCVGMLNYLVTRTRPDVGYATSILSRYTNSPRRIHWRMVLRLVYWLDRYPDCPMVFRKVKEPKLVCYSDASACAEYAVKAHRGYMWSFGGCFFAWKSKKIDRLVFNVHEAEIFGVVAALSIARIYKDIFVQLGVLKSKSPITLYTDSYSTIKSFERKDELPKKTRNMNLPIGMIRAAMEELNVHLSHIPGKDNPADQLTKPLRVDDVISQAKLVVRVE